jgi:hypothetical protein
MQSNNTLTITHKKAVPLFPNARAKPADVVRRIQRSVSRLGVMNAGKDHDASIIPLTV